MGAFYFNFLLFSLGELLSQRSKWPDLLSTYGYYDAFALKKESNDLVYNNILKTSLKQRCIECQTLSKKKLVNDMQKKYTSEQKDYERRKGW